MTLDTSSIPDSWRVRPIREITLRTAQRNPEKHPDKLFRYVDVSSVDNTLFKIRDATVLKGSEAPSRARKEIKENDVLFATVRPTLKRVALIPKDLDGEIASTGYCVLRADPGKCDPRFLYSYLLTDWFIAAMGKLERGVSYPAVSDTDVFSAKVPAPPLPEQRKIAAVLGTVQKAIEQQERIIQTTTELKKTLMQKLFTEGLRKEPQKETEIGLMPKSWDVMELGKFFQIKHGYAFDGEFFKPSGEFILMTPGHFNEVGGFRDQGEKTKYYVGEIPGSYILGKDDLVVAMTEQKSGLLGSAAFVPEAGRYLHNQRLGLIVELDTALLSKRYLFHIFNTPQLRIEVAKTSTGSKVKHTSPTKLRAVKAWIPPNIDEQNEIADALDAVEQKVAASTRKKATIENLFRTLLHQLMTAQVKVNDVDTSEFVA